MKYNYMPCHLEFQNVLLQLDKHSGVTFKPWLFTKTTWRKRMSKLLLDMRSRRWIWAVSASGHCVGTVEWVACWRFWNTATCGVQIGHNRTSSPKETLQTLRLHTFSRNQQSYRILWMLARYYLILRTILYRVIEFVMFIFACQVKTC